MTRCWYLCWGWSEGSWMESAPAAQGDAGGRLVRHWSPAQSAGPGCSRWHAAGFPSCWRSCSAGCWAPAPSVWSSSRSCCTAGWADRPPGSCSERFPRSALINSRCFSGRTARGLLLSFRRCKVRKGLCVPMILPLFFKSRLYQTTRDQTGLSNCQSGLYRKQAGHMTRAGSTR